jgi:DNA-binding Xre family transcriptional regulator
MKTKKTEENEQTIIAFNRYFWNAVDAQLRSKDKSVRWLAKACNLSNQTLLTLRYRKNVPPGFSVVLRICKALELPPSVLTPPKKSKTIDVGPADEMARSIKSIGSLVDVLSQEQQKAVLDLMLVYTGAGK